MRKADAPLKGSLLCARFTFVQEWKTRANLISFVILLLFAMFAPSFRTVIPNSMNSYGCEIDTVILADESGIGFPDMTALGEREAYYASVSFTEENCSLGERDVRMIFRVEDGSPVLVLERSESSTVDDATLQWLYEDSISLFRVHLLKAAGMSEQEAELLANGVGSESFTAEGYAAYLTDTGEETDWDTYKNNNGQSTDTSGLQLVFSIATMMVSMMAASFIIREVIAEKASKLVDLLMVSLRAPALLLGKILGVLGYVITMLLGVLAGFLISDTVTARFTGSSYVAALLADYGTMLKNTDAAAWLVLFVTLVLGLLLFALLAGLMGAGCSTEEDTSSALGVPMLLIMGGYMISIVGSAFQEPAISRAFCLIPVLSTFTIPVQYLCGGIGIGTVAASWLIQAGVIAVLIWLCGTLYSTLLVYKGSRLNLRSIVKMALANRKERA